MSVIVPDQGMTYRLLKAARGIDLRNFLPVVFPTRIVGRDFSTRDTAIYGSDYTLQNYTPAVDGRMVAELRTTGWSAQIVRCEAIIFNAGTGVRLRDGVVSLQVWPSNPSPWVYDVTAATQQPLQLFGLSGPVNQTMLYGGKCSANATGFNPFNIPADGELQLTADAPLFVGPDQSLTFNCYSTGLGGAGPWNVTLSVLWREPDPPRTP